MTFSISNIVNDTVEQFTGYGNKLNKNGCFQRNWTKMAECFNERIENPGTKKVSVVAAQTGSGKTLLTHVFLAHLLAHTDKSAVLLVNQRETAEEMKREIEAHSTELNKTHSGTVVASYSGSIKFNGGVAEGVNLFDYEAKSSQILIICHAQVGYCF